MYILVITISSLSFDLFISPRSSCSSLVASCPHMTSFQTFPDCFSSRHIYSLPHSWRAQEVPGELIRFKSKCENVFNGSKWIQMIHAGSNLFCLLGWWWMNEKLHGNMWARHHFSVAVMEIPLEFKQQIGKSSSRATQRDITDPTVSTRSFHSWTLVVILWLCYYCRQVFLKLLTWPQMCVVPASVV